MLQALQQAAKAQDRTTVSLFRQLLREGLAKESAIPEREQNIATIQKELRNLSNDEIGQIMGFINGDNGLDGQSM